MVAGETHMVNWFGIGRDDIIGLDCRGRAIIASKIEKSRSFKKIAEFDFMPAIRYTQKFMARAALRRRWIVLLSLRRGTNMGHSVSAALIAAGDGERGSGQWRQPAMLPAPSSAVGHCLLATRLATSSVLLTPQTRVATPPGE